MKVRSGFVSNSSSSSFFLITSLRNHEKVISNFTEYEKAVIDQIVTKYDRKLFGIEIVVGEEFNGDWNTIEEMHLPESFKEDDSDSRHVAWEKIPKVGK